MPMLKIEPLVDICNKLLDELGAHSAPFVTVKRKKSYYDSGFSLKERKAAEALITAEQVVNNLVNYLLDVYDELEE